MVAPKPRRSQLFRLSIILVIAVVAVGVLSIYNEIGADDENAKLKEKIPRSRPTFFGRTIAQTMSYHGAGWLIRESREKEERPSVVMEALELKPGMTVCDMGCGNGFYSLMMAEAIGEKGKVLAVDIQPEMLRFLEARAAKAEVKNIEPILGSVINPNLPKGKVDLLLMVDVYHEFSHPKQMLEHIRESLSEDGVVALLEYRGEDPWVPIKPLHKMTKKQILKEYKANGFELVREFDELPWQHLMFFGRAKQSK